MLTEARPVRHPDASSPEVMTRRAWWLVALNVLIPGSAQALAGNRRLGRFGLGATLVLWAVAIVGVVLALLWRPALFALASNWFFLLALQIFLVFYAVLWVVLTLDMLRLTRLVKVAPITKIAAPVVAILMLIATSGSAAYLSSVTASARDAITLIFGGGSDVVEPTDGYYNILLLGADSGQGRDSMRYDSISVVSVNATTGQVTITGIPRDMGGFTFSDGPMADLYPNGFEGHVSVTCGWSDSINQLRNAAEVCRDDAGEGLYPDATSKGSDPGIEATKDAAEGIMGIEIPYYVFIDMDGFADLIDALGGVTITVDERLPEGPGPDYDGQPAEEWATGWIEVGEQVMDGETAQWYARSRYTTSDWDRMQRQRELQQAVLAQFTPSNVLTRFNEVMAAGSDLVQTDIPEGLLPTLMELADKARQQEVQTIELTPENNVSDVDTDWAAVREMIDEALHPPTATPEEEE